MTATTGFTITTPQALAAATAAEPVAMTEAAEVLVVSSENPTAINSAAKITCDSFEQQHKDDQKGYDSNGKQIAEVPSTTNKDKPIRQSTKSGTNNGVAPISFSTTTASIAACADVLAAFSVNWCYSISEFLRRFLDDAYLRQHRNVDPTVVCRICWNYTKHAKLIDTVVDAFMATDLGSTAKESDRFILCIAAYWCLFCLNNTHHDDSTAKENWSFKTDLLDVFDPWLGYALQRFIWSFFQLDIDAFSSFLKVRTLKHNERLDDFMLETVQYSWFNILDREFIEQNVLQPFMRNRQRAQAQALENLHARDRRRRARRLRAATKQRPFTLTQPKPPAMYDIEAVPEMSPARPFPRKLFENMPLEQRQLAERRESNRAQCRQRFEKAQDEAPNCASPAYMKSSRRIELPKQVRPEFRSQPMPQFYAEGGAGDAGVEDGAAISELDRQTNRAYILRESHRLKQKRDSVVRRLHEASDVFIKDLDFERRMNERIEDEQTQDALNAVNKRVYAMEIFEKAIVKTDQVVAEKQAASLRIRQERDKLLEQHDRAAQRQHEKLHSAALAHRIAMRDGIDDAMAKTALDRQWQAHLMRTETDQIKLRCVQAREEEFEKRRQIIGAIKAMRARLAAHTVAELDDTQIAGYGFLTELSLAELHERLQLLKHVHAQELADKSRRIVAERCADREALAKIKTLIAKHRHVERSVAQQPHGLKKNNEARRHRVEATLKSDATYVNTVKRIHKALHERRKTYRALKRN